jgi:hypothetical protein
MSYARLSPDLQTVELLDALADEAYAQLLAANNPKTQHHRLQVIDAQPVPGANQKVAPAGWVVEPTQVRKTWQLVAKSDAEIDADTRTADNPQMKLDIETQLAVTNNMRSAMTANQRLNELEKDTRILLRFARRRL